MCGILGTFPATETHFFRSALDKLTHRGPDGFGIWQHDNHKVTFGHRRLAILDLSESGKQPMSYLHYTITFNGEIYNFIEIREELKKKGYQFASQSDTEVVLAAFDCWGEKCLQKFNGMWAFAIWDEKKQTLFISRDRFGKKPFFYSFNDGKLIFASEMKAITPFFKEVKAAKDFSFFVQNQFRYESTEKCLIDGILRFPAGRYAYIRAGESKISPISFWNTLENLHEVPKTYADQVAQFRELFIDACKIRMRSDVPIGTALSGGVDSSAVISTMSHIGKMQNQERVSNNWQHAFVASFPDSFLDETHYAKMVVDNIGIDATYVNINPAKGIENLSKYLYLFEELYITSPIPMMELYGAIRKGGVVVTIDGHGADELLSGYGKNLYEAFYDCGLNFSDVNNIMDTYEGTTKLPNGSKLNGYYKQTYRDYLGFLKMRTGGPVDLVKYYLRELVGKNPKENPAKGELGRFNAKLYELFHQTVLPTLLRNYDRYAMASGVEIRMPFMDYRLVNFCFSLPWQSKIKGGYTKSIVRDALKDLVPHDVIYRKNKIGFNTPFVEWMKNEWKPFLLDTISSQDFLQSEFINGKELAQKVTNVIANEDANFGDGESSWTELMPYFWEKSFLKEENKGVKAF